MPSFHQRKKIEAKAATAWKANFQPQPLKETSKQLTRQLDYRNTGISYLEWYTKTRRTEQTETASYHLKLTDKITKNLTKTASSKTFDIEPFLLTALAIYVHKVTAAQTITIGVPVAHQTLPMQITLKEAMTAKEIEQQAIKKYQYLQQNSQFSSPHTPEQPLYEIAIQKANTLHSRALENNKNQIETLILHTSEDGQMPLKLELSKALFFNGMGEWASGHFQKILETILTQPNEKIAQISLLTEAEKRQLKIWNDTNVPYPKDKTIVDLFEEQVIKTPDNIALIFEDKQLTYQQLNEESNKVAHYLRETYAIQPDDIIALQLERSEWMIIAILGVMKAGAAYLPIAPDFPKIRVEYLLKDSRAKALLTDKGTYEIIQLYQLNTPIAVVEQLKHSKQNNPRLTTRSSQDLAYIIYTSGSTGQPKGVLVEHQGVVNFVQRQIVDFQMNQEDAVLQFSSYTFDTSVAEILLALFTGATLVMPPDNRFSGAEFLAFIQKNKITILDLPPKFLTALNGVDLSPVRVIILGGEAPDATTLKHYTDRYRCFNSYGPTETSVSASMYEIPSDWSGKNIPIGSPLYNTQIYILNEQLQLQPLGIIGELCIGGVGLSRGYLNQPALTAEKFIPHPFKKGERIYKTGDLSRWLPDGNIEFLGRIDHQLKIRGYRIEAGEIEQILLTHSAIQSAVVMGQELNTEKELVAYLVTKSPTTLPNTSELRAFLSQRLPDYMLPTYFVELETLPLSNSGKVNRKMLPLPDPTTAFKNNIYIAPRNQTESQLVNIWQALLNQPTIGVQDNFFYLGGHSLKALRIIAQIEEELLVQISIKDFFRHLTIEALAKEIEYIKALSNLQTTTTSNSEAINNKIEIEEIW